MRGEEKTLFGRDVMQEKPGSKDALKQALDAQRRREKKRKRK